MFNRETLPHTRVILAGNIKADPIWEKSSADHKNILKGFRLVGLDDSTLKAFERATTLKKEGYKVRVVIIIDHPLAQGVHRQELMHPDMKINEKRRRSRSPHCDDLHPDINTQLSSFLKRVEFDKDELGILFEETAFQTRDLVFPMEKNCETATAVALRMISGYQLDPKLRTMTDTFFMSPLEIFLSKEGGLDFSKVVAAKSVYFEKMGLQPNLISIIKNGDVGK